MVDFKLNDVSFAFPGGKTVLENINLQINSGEFVVLCGKSGSGKTTLLRLLKPALTPSGRLGGTIDFFGKSSKALSPFEAAAKIGFVMQNPETQTVTYKVRSELLFGLENLGLNAEDAALRVAETVALFSLEPIIESKISELSGGQKQLVNLASAVAMRPQALILDESTAQLDPVSAKRLLDAVLTLCREYGVTVIITEHRLEKLVEYADRLLVLENGVLVYDGSPKNINNDLLADGGFAGAAMPLYMRLHAGLSFPGSMPVSLSEGKNELSSFLGDNIRYTRAERKPRAFSKETAVKICSVGYSYDAKKYVLRDLDLDVKMGSFFAVLGANGAGKSTLLDLIAGLTECKKGRIEIFSKNIKKYAKGELYKNNIALLPQKCEALFAGPTVFEDLENVLRSENCPKEERKKKIEQIARFCEIEALLSSHPYDVSGGELQRCALAAVLLKKPRLLLLDEPTKGMDAVFKKHFAAKIKELCKNGTTVIMVSHDTEFCSGYCDECALIFDGRVVLCKEAESFFDGNFYYTTSASRLTRGIFENAVTESEVFELCRKNLSC